MSGTDPASGSRLPTYAELQQRTDGPPGSAWGVFGADDEIGTINLLTDDRVRRAAGLVRSGKRFNLDWPINAFDPPISKLRRPAQHTMFQRHDNHRDDYVDSLYLQSTTQIDGLRHQRHPEYGFYNGHSDDSIRPGDPTLGIQRWVDRGIAGRGVVLDVERALAARGRPLDHAAGEAFTVEALEQAAADGGVDFEDGDILVVRTGWCRYYFEALDEEARREFPDHVRSCGLAQSRETLEWLWDHRVSMIVSDTVAVEAEPGVPDSPFTYAFHNMMHQELIPLLGLCLGELWKLDDLADDCASDGRYECMVVANPLNLIGGVGSMANALALK